MSSQFARLRGALDRVGTTTPGTIVGMFAEDLTAIMNHYVEVVREAAELKAARAQPAQAGQGTKVKEPHFAPQEAITEDGWTEWVCPKPKGYLAQCCDCCLVHEIDTRVAKYEPRPSENFEVVTDPDLQVQWRVRRRDDLRQEIREIPAFEPDQTPDLDAGKSRFYSAQAGHVPEASCGECGKKASDGWALYCVACMEKAGLPAQAGQVLTDEDVLRAAARTLDSEVVEVSPLSCIKDFARAIEQAVLAKRVPMTESAWQNPLHPDQISDKPIPNWTPLYRLMSKISDPSNAQHFSAEAAVKAFCTVGGKGGA